MKISEREKKLIALLLVVIAFYGYNRFILLGQANKIEALRAERDLYDEDMSKLNEYLLAEGKFSSDFLAFNDQIKALKSTYFSGTPQEEYILLINKCVAESGLKAIDLSFTKEKEEELGSQSFYLMDTNLQYEADYTSLMKFIELLRSYNASVVIKELNVSTNSNELLKGNIAFTFYSLPKDFDSRLGNFALFQQEGNSSLNPFKYVNKDTEASDNDADNVAVEIKIGPSRVMLEAFEASSAYALVTSGRSVKGSLSSSIIAKAGRNSIRVEFDFPKLDTSGFVAVSIASNALEIKEAPKAITLWVYSFNASNSSIGLKYKDTNNTFNTLSLSDEMNWGGWRKLEVALPQDRKLYPIKLDSVVIESNGMKETGVILIDSLELVYAEESAVKSILEENSSYWHYEVQGNETLRDISIKFYNDVKGIAEIMRVNGLKSQSLSSGKKLIIPKR